MTETFSTVEIKAIDGNPVEFRSGQVIISATLIPSVQGAVPNSSPISSGVTATLKVKIGSNVGTPFVDVPMTVSQGPNNTFTCTVQVPHNAISGGIYFAVITVIWSLPYREVSLTPPAVAP